MSGAQWQCAGWVAILVGRPSWETGAIGYLPKVTRLSPCRKTGSHQYGTARHRKRGRAS